MRLSPLVLTACLLCSGVVLDTGCKKTPTTPAQAGVRNSDGSITNPDGSVTYPAGVTPPGWSGPASAPTTVPAGSTVAAQPVPPNTVATGPGGSMVQTGTPPMERPATAPGAPAAEQASAPQSVTVPSGTRVTVRLNQGLAASRNDVGDRFTGVLEYPVRAHGETVFGKGTPVSGEVVASKGKGRFKGSGDLGIELTEIGHERVHTSEYEKVAKGRGKRTAGFIGGGGGLGALIGGIAGGGKGALIGGLAGAGAGTAAGAYTGNRDVVIHSESVITFRLRDSIRR